MPRNPQGIFSLAPVYQATPGTNIRSEQHNVPLEDIAQAMTDSLPRNGSAPMTGPLAMGGRRITGLGAPTAATDAATRDYVDGRTGTPTPGSITLAGIGLVGRTEDGIGPGRTIGIGSGIEFSGVTLRAALGDGLAYMAGRIASVVSRFSTQAEATAGSDNGSAMTPLRTAQAIAAADLQPDQVRMASPGLVGRSAGGAGDARIISEGSGITLLDGFIRAVVARTATGDEARAASNNDAAMTPLNTLQFANANLLGMQQSWSTVGRSSGTTYRNTTGKPIQIVAQYDGGSDTRMQVSTNGSTWVSLAWFGGIISFVVPDTHYYRLINAGTIQFWSELR